jgi:hypothetical protein
VRFRQAVRNTPQLASHLREGLQALREVDRNRLRTSTPRILRGSLNLEEAFPRGGSDEPRWDYCIGLAGRRADIAVWLEVHPASSQGHIGEMKRKLEWLRAWLKRDAPALRKLPAQYVWLVTGRVCFHSGSPQRRQVAQMGLLLRAGQLDLDPLRRSE